MVNDDEEVYADKEQCNDMEVSILIKSSDIE